MGKRKTVGTFLIFLLILLIVFLGSILLVFKTSGKLFIGEIIILAFLIFIAFIASFGVYFGSRWGFTLLSIMFALLLFDLLLIYFYTKGVDKIYFITIVISAIGFIASVSKIGQKEEPVEEVTSEKKTGGKTVEYTPGKYLASKTGNTYHVPKCEWAKKIRKPNIVWYDSKEDVKKAGLKPHNCVR